MPRGDAEPVTPAVIESEIFRLLGQRQETATICPSEVARALHPNGDAWRGLMPQVRQVASDLARAGRLAVTRRGERVDATSPGGPIRLGHPCKKDP